MTRAESPDPGLSRWFGEGSRVVLQNLCAASRPHCAVGGKGQSEHVLSARLMTAAESIAFPARSPQRRRRAAGMTRYPREGSTAMSGLGVSEGDCTKSPWLLSTEFPLVDGGAL